MTRARAALTVSLDADLAFKVRSHARDIGVSTSAFTEYALNYFFENSGLTRIIAETPAPPSPHVPGIETRHRDGRGLAVAKCSCGWQSRRALTTQAVAMAAARRHVNYYKNRT